MDKSGKKASLAGGSPVIIKKRLVNSLIITGFVIDTYKAYN